MIELKEYQTKAGSVMRQLLLIQLPNDKQTLSDGKDSWVPLQDVYVDSDDKAYRKRNALIDYLNEEAL